MSGTIRLEDMRLFAKVAETASFTTAGRALGIPKQTLSRRIAELERVLGVQLLQRTTRRVLLNDAGAAYARRCADIVRMADEANRAVSDANEAHRGHLRVTADPLFGDAFLTDVVIAYARRWPAVRVEVMLTRRKVDLAEEGFDIAFRVGRVNDASLSGFRLGAARIRYCVSPSYVGRRGKPRCPEDLASHDCLVVTSDGAPAVWPFRGTKKEARMMPVSGRLILTSFAMAREAAVAGLGIALFPEFACVEEIRRKRLVPVLEDWTVDVGSVWLLHASRRLPAARVRAFVDLAREHFGSAPPWVARRRRSV